MSDENDIEQDDEISEDLHDADFDVSSSHGEIASGSVSARESLRRQLQSDVEAFLAAGGQIREVAPNTLNDPPRKPQSNYGGQPI